MRLHINAIHAVMGGAARHLPPFLRALADVRPDWAVCAWVTAGHEPDVGDRPVTIRAVPARGHARQLWWESALLPRELRRHGCDALVNLTNSGPLVNRTPSVLYQRNPIWFDRRWTDRLDRRQRLGALSRRQLAYLQMRGSAVTIVPSAAMEGFLRDRGGAPATARVLVVPHAVDLERFGPTERTWPPPSDRPVRLLCVGHAAPHKNQRMLVPLVAALRAAGHDVELWLTVDRRDAPAYVEGIERVAGDLDVTDRVRLLGRVPDPERLYGEADVMVFPSISESFGFPVAEAMAAGIPVAASAIPSTTELLGGDGWFFDPDDVAGAATAIARLLATPPDDLFATVHRARKTVERLTWAANATGVAAAVESVLPSDGTVV
jgi:glycosyltransferase involved in cell wall biosynthesis